MSNCLVYQVRGYHVFCSWNNLECSHSVPGDTDFCNHCKYCLVGMIETVGAQEAWADDDVGNLMRNIFNG
jgi:hypothetical protein